jgi:hypothetical protein
VHHLDERLGASVNERALSGRPMTSEVTIPIKEYPLERVPAPSSRCPTPGDKTSLVPHDR